MYRPDRYLWLLIGGILLNAAGCMPSRPFYFGDDGDLSHYRAMAVEIEEPDLEADRIGDVQNADHPLTLRNAEADEIWDLPLQEAVQTALANSKVVRSLTNGGFNALQISSGGRGFVPQRISSGATSASSVYAPTLIETDPRFGPEGVLSAFDAQLSTSLFWNKNDKPQNFFITGFQQPVFQQDLGTQTTELNKKTATGGQVFVRNHNNYELNNNQSNLFHSAWTADVEAEFRHPLLQGAGVQFNRVAGPNSISGFYNGVVIARLQVDEALADFEAQVRNIVADVEQAYWRLSFCYRDLDAKSDFCNSSLDYWRWIRLRNNPLSEAQAREQYFAARTQMEDARSEIFTAESNLRYMLGIAATDRRLIRPSDEPTTALVVFDWYDAHQEMLARQVELRGQKFRIKEAELRLTAAKNFLLPRLDFQALYRWRGLGETLFASKREDTATQIVPGVAARAVPQASPFNSAYQTLTQGNYQEWQMGFNFQMPIGFRKEMAGVRNEELRLARERAVLQEMELEISHQLTEAFRNLDREYTAIQTGFNRVIAARREVDMRVKDLPRKKGEDDLTQSFNLLLQARRRLTDDEAQLYAAIGRYNVSIAAVHFRKGSLLEYNGVQLAEGPWADKAYFDAYKRAKERDAGVMIDYGFTRPNVVTRGVYPQSAADLMGPPVNGQPTLAPPQESIPASIDSPMERMSPAMLPELSGTIEAGSELGIPEFNTNDANAILNGSHETVPSPTAARIDRPVAVRQRSQRVGALD